MSDDDDNNKEDSFTELLVDLNETCIRTGIMMMKTPLVICSDVIDKWAKAMDAMREDIESSR